MGAPELSPFSPKTRTSLHLTNCRKVGLYRDVCHAAKADDRVGKLSLQALVIWKVDVVGQLPGMPQEEDKMHWRRSTVFGMR